MTDRISAGVLLFRRRDGGFEVLIAHPGGPFWKNRDDGAWSIPKGEVAHDEDLEAAARRELTEEVGVVVTGDMIPLGAVRQKSGKTVVAWGWEGDFDPARLESNRFTMEWPPRSGTMASFPEIDRVAWVTADVAARKLNPAQVEFVERLRTRI